MTESFRAYRQIGTPRDRLSLIDCLPSQRSPPRRSFRASRGPHCEQHPYRLDDVLPLVPAAEYVRGVVEAATVHGLDGQHVSVPRVMEHHRSVDSYSAHDSSFSISLGRESLDGGASVPSARCCALPLGSAITICARGVSCRRPAAYFARVRGRRGTDQLLSDSQP